MKLNIYEVGKMEKINENKFIKPKIIIKRI